jgi:ribosomal-protein-alanine N-acetyltransferase
MRILKADETDAGTIREIAIAANIDAWSVEDYRAEINRTGSYVLKAVVEGSMNGFLLARTVPGESEKPDVDLYNIAVRPDKLHQGVGSLLMTQLLTDLESTNVANIWLEVRESNVAAIRFYEKHGFIAELTRPNFYANPVENAVIMRLKRKSDSDVNSTQRMLDSQVEEE